jgi:transposase
LLGYFVFLLYSMRCVDCRRCGAVLVEQVPWGDGKRTLTKAYMLFLARWARRLSWKETAAAFRTSWDKVFDAVEHVVTWGLEHRTLGRIDASGVDEIQYAKGHKYLTLVYQIDIGITRLLWVGKERTIESFQGFFTTMGEQVVSQIVFVCSDMWQPYLKVIREKCSEALHILDRFHIVATLSQQEMQTEVAADYVRRFETNRDRLSTFLEQDGIPWNNNNAEHAIKAFARLRNVIGGTSTTKGLRKYLVLLSISEACKCKGVRFLDFLLSQESDVDTFVAHHRS